MEYNAQMIPLKQRIGKKTAFVIDLYVWGQYATLFVEIHRLSYVHRISVFVWMFLVIYPIPWLLIAEFRRQIRNAVAQKTVDPQVSMLLSDWMSILLFVVYVAIRSAAQLYAAS
jgi:hypothetical protein